MPGGQTWNVQSIDADGAYLGFLGPANSWNVFIYADNAGLPGMQVYSILNTTVTVNGTTFYGKPYPCCRPCSRHVLDRDPG